MGDRLGLHRGVDADPLQALRLDGFGPRRRGDGLLQQDLDAVLAEASGQRTSELGSIGNLSCK
jgi:hypothetical protein